MVKLLQLFYDMTLDLNIATYERFVLSDRASSVFQWSYEELAQRIVLLQRIGSFIQIYSVYIRVTSVKPAPKAQWHMLTR